jgi:hypothetical protein
MTDIRDACTAKGWVPVYHYTSKLLGPLILKTGFRMSTQGQGDGGVYFSVRGPYCYYWGSNRFEENIIADCFGVERLEEYRGKGMLDLCFVYGADPSMLSPAPGGRDNAKVASKATFHAISLPTLDGNYFLRPDRILGAFIMSVQPRDFDEGSSALAAERAADAITKDHLGVIQHEMEVRGLELRDLHFKLHHHGEGASVGGRGDPANKNDYDDTDGTVGHDGVLGGVGKDHRFSTKLRPKLHLARSSMISLLSKSGRNANRAGSPLAGDIEMSAEDLQGHVVWQGKKNRGSMQPGLDEVQFAPSAAVASRLTNSNPLFRGGVTNEDPGTQGEEDSTIL